MERRLAAILAADVVGYSKLMAENEAGTLVALKSHRVQIFDPAIAKHNGRLVKLMGDGVLVEFASLVDAVECAVAVQTACSTADDKRVRLRIGVNLGDIIIDGGDIYGDGVNIAARLEAMAAPGGVCISSIVYESLGNRVDVAFVDAGEHEVKNIPRPIHVYHWTAKAGDARSAGDHRPVSDRLPATVPHRSTISVTPFENLSNDSELGFLCEGIAEDIITALGNISQLTVVRPTPALGARDGAGSLADTAARQPARYTLEGSVRKAGNRIRVSAQLLDSFSGIQSWAQRYDRDVGDMFQVQDDVARNIVIAVHGELGAGSYSDRWQRGTNNFEAWQLSAKSFHEFQKHSPDSIAKSAAMWDRAFAIDPDFLAPRAASAFCYAQMALWKDRKTAEEYIAKARSYIDIAMAAAPRDARPYSAKRAIEIAKGNYAEAIAAAQTACDLEPNEPSCVANLALAVMCADEPRKALALMTKATQEISNYPGWFATVKIQSHYMMGNLAEAVHEAEDILRRAPDFYAAPVLLAALNAELGRVDEARKMGEKVRQMDPQFSVETFVKSQGLKNIEHRERLFTALTSVGLPE